jgi:hypothetical protein
MKIIPLVILGLFLAPRCWAVSFDVPKGWKVEAPGNEGIEFNAFHGDDAAIIVVKRGKDEVEGDSLAKVLHTLLENSRTDPSYANETKAKAVKAGALEGLSISYDKIQPDPKGVKIPMRVQFTVFPHKGDYLIVVASARKPLFPKFEKSFDAILPTLKP